MALVPYVWLMLAFIMGAVVPVLDARASQSAFATPPGYVFEKPAACQSGKTPALIYNICADQMALFSETLARAAASGKTVAVVFGATWCPSCKSLKAVLPSAEFFAMSPGGKPLLERIAVSEIAISTLESGKVKPVQSGEAVLALVLNKRPDVKQRAVPFLAVVDPRSGKTFVRNLDDMEPAPGAGWNTARLAGLIAAADIDVRGGSAAPGEPGWFARKWQRLWR